MSIGIDDDQIEYDSIKKLEEIDRGSSADTTEKGEAVFTHLGPRT